ncbi:hypothetical protein I5L38_18510 [Serratia marcescens]|uniref:hypothetical protein n=1 Tax=Serratia nevei TaxID=2703794 RepID=UPI0018D97B7C|nr:hypothetical protein [Serratia marcescens]
MPLNRPGDKFSMASEANGIRLQAYVRGETEAIVNKTIGRGAFSLEYEGYGYRCIRGKEYSGR